MLAEKYKLLYMLCTKIIKYLVIVFDFTGTEGQHEASVQPDHGASVPALHQTGQVQEAALLALLLPLCAARATQVPDAGMEHRLRVQRLRL